MRSRRFLIQENQVELYKFENGLTRSYYTGDETIEVSLIKTNVEANPNSLYSIFENGVLSRWVIRFDEGDFIPELYTFESDVADSSDNKGQTITVQMTHFPIQERLSR